jgi:dynein heavy chain
LFTGDPSDVSENLKTILRVCVAFKAIYFDYKTRASNECPSSPWRFQNPALFGRLDAYLERVHDVLDIIQTHSQFSKLEKVEVGGTKGKNLTTSVRAIYTDFLASIKTFQSAPYDIMNVDMKQFDQDFFVFRSSMNELERRLASVVIQAFDDSVSVMARFKLLDAFEGLLDREIIMADLEKKSTDLLLAFSSDLKSVQEMFFLFNENPPVNDNLPPRSGAVTWARGLMERVDDPMLRLKSLSKGILETEEGKEVVRSHSTIIHALREYETIHVEDWAKEIENTSQEKLKQNLLVRDDSSYLRVNFDPQLVCLLREVKYFTQLGIEVPASAMQIYKNNEIFRQQTGNLDLIVNIYNKMLETLLAEERPLLASKLEAIDKALLKGLKHLNWKSASITEFIDQTKKDVKEASSILLKIKQNVIDMKAILTQWTESVLMERKSGKTYTAEEFNQGNDALIAKRYKEIEGDGEKIHGFLASSQATLKASKGSVAWKVYQDFVNQLAVDGICEAITSSLKFFFLQVDGTYLATNDICSLLEVRLDLKDQAITFFPFLGSNAKGTGTRDLSVSWMSHMVNVSTLIKRLDSGDGDYLNDVQDDIELKTLIHSISKNILHNESLCEKYRLMYDQHGHLWRTNLEKSFKEFIQDHTPEGQKYPPLKKVLALCPSFTVFA